MKVMSTQVNMLIPNIRPFEALRGAVGSKIRAGQPACIIDS
jgi:hypothetical protein